MQKEFLKVPNVYLWGMNKSTGLLYIYQMLARTNEWRTIDQQVKLQTKSFFKKFYIRFYVHLETSSDTSGLAIPEC